MRIVYILTSLGMGGAERQAIAIAERMSARGHAVALLVLRPRLAEEWHTSVDVVYLDILKTPVSFFRGIVRARRFVHGFRPGLIHSHMFHANIFARLLKIIVPEPMVLSSVHNVYEGGWMRMLAYRITDPLCHCTALVSQAAADRYVQLKAVAQHKCMVVTNGIDTVEFAPDLAHRSRVRSELGTGDSFVWLASGRIVPAKDFPNLLSAFTKVRAARTDAQLWIAAETSGPQFGRVSNLAYEMGLCDAIRWFGLRRDMPALLDAADGFVSSSAWEGMPLAVGEAMAMEKPVVATDVGGVRELVSDVGFVVPSENPDTLAGAMLDVMWTPLDQCAALGRRARQRIQTCFSMDAKVEEWERLYGESAAWE